MKNEADLERLAIRGAMLRGWLIRKFLTPGARGASDRIIWADNGVVGFLELKNPNGTGRESHPQRMLRERIQGMGHIASVVASEKELEEFLDLIQAEVERRGAPA